MSDRFLESSAIVRRLKLWAEKAPRELPATVAALRQMRRDIEDRKQVIQSFRVAEYFKYSIVCELAADDIFPNRSAFDFSESYLSPAPPESRTLRWQKDVLKGAGSMSLPSFFTSLFKACERKSKLSGDLSYLPVGDRRKLLRDLFQARRRLVKDLDAVRSYYARNSTSCPETDEDARLRMEAKSYWDDLLKLGSDLEFAVLARLSLLQSMCLNRIHEVSAHKNQVGFLSLLIDGDRREISRSGVDKPPVRLTRALWTMFTAVYKKRSVGASVDEIRAAMNDADLNDDNLSATKSRLNKELSPLGVAVVEREWRLVFT